MKRSLGLIVKAHHTKFLQFEFVFKFKAKFFFVATLLG